MEAALLERMYFCKVGGEYVPPPTVDGGLVEHRLTQFRSLVCGGIRSFTPVSLHDFVEMYKGPKKERYRKAVDSLLEMPVRKRDAEVSAFVKREKGNFTKSPRPIQTRDPRYHASLGRFLKPMEYIIYSSIARIYNSDNVVTKGLNLNQTGECLYRKWNRFDDPVAVGLDATKFDMHVSREILQWEHSVYKMVCKDPKLSTLLSWQLDNKGRAFLPDGKLKYKLSGRRCSGDMNTALGNCLIMCALVHEYSRSRGVHVDLANNGDDCVVFMERHQLQQFSEGLDEWFLEMGFRMTREEPVYCFEQVEFCQMHPVRVGETYRMVRKPLVALEKDTTCLLTISNDEYLDWLNGVGHCGGAACAGVPVMQSFYDRLRMGGRSFNKQFVEQTGMSFMVRDMFVTCTPVSQSTRFSFWLAFGIDPDQQLALEQRIKDTPIDTTPCEFYPTSWGIDRKTKRFNTNIRYGSF